jgi:hypothetical protein
VNEIKVWTRLKGKSKYEEERTGGDPVAFADTPYGRVSEQSLALLALLF